MWGGLFLIAAMLYLTAFSAIFVGAFCGNYLRKKR
jgi:hypothetical protein